MSTKKTVSLIVGGLIAIFVIALLLAGVPKGCEPPVNKAPSTN
ncbi:MAG: hypothetical protein ACOYMI_01185 [Phycisphaerales bacterium]|jgi:hypothetical protein